MKHVCSICRELNETIHLNLYTSGSEGTDVCKQCEIDLVYHIQRLKLLAGRTMKMGYHMARQRGKDGDDESSV